MNLVSNYKTDFRRCYLCRSLKTKLLEQLATLYIGRHRYVKAGSGTSIGNYRGLKALPVPVTSKKGGKKTVGSTSDVWAVHVSAIKKDTGSGTDIGKYKD